MFNEWQIRSFVRTMPYNAKVFATRSGEAADYVRGVVPQEDLDEYSVYYSFPNGRNKTIVNHSGYTSFPGTISYRDFNNKLGNGQNQPAWKVVMKANIDAAEEHGAEWLWQTSATVLLQNEGGDVTGAVGKGPDGQRASECHVDAFGMRRLFCQWRNGTRAPGRGSSAR